MTRGMVCVRRLYQPGRGAFFFSPGQGLPETRSRPVTNQPERRARRDIPSKSALTRQIRRPLFARGNLDGRQALVLGAQTARSATGPHGRPLTEGRHATPPGAAVRLSARGGEPSRGEGGEASGGSCPVRHSPVASSIQSASSWSHVHVTSRPSCDTAGVTPATSSSSGSSSSGRVKPHG